MSITLERLKCSCGARADLYSHNPKERAIELRRLGWARVGPEWKCPRCLPAVTPELPLEQGA